jgi:signal transduction histidine kinase
VATVTAERKRWHAIFRLLERDERVFAVLLAVAMVGGLATLGFVPLRPREEIDLYSVVVWFALYKVGVFVLVTVQPRATRGIFLGALAIDLLLVFVLVLLTGGGASLFYLLFFPLVAVNAYYFGPWIAFVAALTAGGLMAAAASLAPPWIGWTGVSLLVVLFGLPAVTVGIVADRERRARGEVEGLLSRLQAAQQELLVSERMATVGRLSLKVAHEVRNPISAIELNAEMLEDIVRARSGADMEEAGGLLAAIRDQVNTLDALTEEYLAFARFPKAHFEEESINQLVEELAAFVRPLVDRQGLTMRVETDPAVPMMEIDRALLRQAIHNLVKNGQEALSRGGTLTISSRALGDAVEIAVADTGPGIAPEVADRLFEQFFTTKPQGTGLGLAISRQIIEEHGGDLRWANRPGGGAVFTIRLPVKVAHA